MKKIIAIGLIAVLTVCLSLTAFASGINTYEQALLDLGKAEYETSEPGVYIKIDESFVAGAETYLSTEGIDITESQYNAVLDQVDVLKNYISENVVVADDAETLSIEDVSKEVYEGLLACFSNIATAMDAKVELVDNLRYSGRVVVQSNTVENAKWIIVEGTVKDTASSVEPIAVVAVVAVVLLAVAAVAIGVSKKKTNA